MHHVSDDHTSIVIETQSNHSSNVIEKLVHLITNVIEILCVPGQYHVFPPLAAIIATSHRGILATRRWRRCTGICAHLSSRAWRSSSRFWGGLSIELIARPNSSQRCSMGLQSGDLGGCSIFVTLPCCRKSRTTLARWGVALSSW